MFCCKCLIYASLLFTCGTIVLESATAGRQFISKHVTCAKDFIQLDIKLKPIFWQRSQTKLVMHLIDKHCKPFFYNRTHISIQTTLYGCGTKLELAKHHVSFANSFTMMEETGTRQLVSYIPDVEIGFRCTYDRNNITRVTGPPLQLDELHSSPSEVQTYFGLPVELRCTFKYGVPPVRAVIFRRNKIIANQENGTNTIKITVGRQSDEFGQYTCLAQDLNNKNITHNIELTKVDPSNISTDGKTVTCTRDKMQLTLSLLSYPWLQRKHFDMHLLDNHCKPYHVNLTHIIVKTTYGECKTIKDNSSDDVTYRNIFMAFVRAASGKLITRVPDVLFPFQCQFNHKEIASSKRNDKEASYPPEPLRSDKAKSTPMNVKSFKGFEVRLVCVFKGGVPPVTITAFKGRKRLTEGVVVRKKVLHITVKTSQRTAFGSYECIASDAKKSRVKQRIILQRAGPRDMTSDGLTVKCKPSYMEVNLSRLAYPWLDPNLLHMSLIQSNCTTYDVTDTHITMRVPLTRCGTRNFRKNKFVLESRNTFVAQAKRPRGIIITYLPQIHFPFTCSYEITRSPGRTVLKAIELLSADVAQSSSSTIYSPVNMTVKIRCVFQGGEPPIKVTFSRRKRIKAHALGRVLGFVLKPHIKDGGRYACKAIDARNNSVTHAINLKIPVNGVIFNKGADIGCGSQFTTIVITRSQYPWFNPRRMHMHLNDPTCQPHVNITHVSFKVPLGGCGSRHITTSRKLMFTNRVFIVNKRNFINENPVGKSIIEIHFYCKYRRIGSLGQKIKGFL